MTKRYDLIGDIHGNLKPLDNLLIKLGYQLTDDAYKHPERTAIFLGDFIDRGHQQRGVINTVRAMIKAGSAQAVMGNHEYNALCFHTENPNNPGVYLRPRNNKNVGQHMAFLNDYLEEPEELEDVLNWFKTLPIWLDLGGIRVIHACWDHTMIRNIQEKYSDAFLTDEFIVKSSDKSQPEYNYIETLLKGKEISLPKSHPGVPDKMGIRRHEIRVRWWDSSVETYKDAYMGPDSIITHIPDDPIEGDHLVTYAEDEPPVFLGHYWLEGTPTMLASNIACTDYSVAREGGKLVAYRWDGEKTIDDSKFVSVDRVDD